MFFFLQPLFISLLPFLIFTVFLLQWLSAAQTTKKKLPPSPRKLPIIGNFHQLGSSPHRALRSLAKHHGPLMLLHLGRVRTVVVSSADAAREIMKTHDLIFSDRPKASIPDRLLYHGKDMAFAPYGDYWRQVRSIGTVHLLSNRRVQSFRNVREEETALMMEEIRRLGSRGVVNLSEVFLSLTNDVVCRVALGKKYCEGEGGRKFMKILVEFEELLGIFCVGDYIPWLAWVDRISGLDARVKKVGNELDEFLECVVREHTHKGEANVFEEQDFVDTLLQIQREDKIGFPIHRDTIKALIMDMFAGGTRTTFTLLEWATAELLSHPKAMMKLQIEVREIVKGKSKVTEDDLKKMQYLKLVIKETLRLHAPVPLLVPRESTQDVKVMGYDITARTQVFINAWAIGRDSSLWEESDEFQPERFLNTSIDFKGLHFGLIPFGAGRRGCPGTTFAIAVNELALANLVHRFDIALPGELRAEDLDMTETTGINVHKKSPLLVVVTPYS